MSIAAKALGINLAILAIAVFLGAWPLVKLWIVIHGLGALIMAYLARTSVETGGEAALG